MGNGNDFVPGRYGPRTARRHPESPIDRQRHLFCATTDHYNIMAVWLTVAASAPSFRPKPPSKPRPEPVVVRNAQERQ